MFVASRHLHNMRKMGYEKRDIPSTSEYGCLKHPLFIFASSDFALISANLAHFIRLCVSFRNIFEEKEQKMMGC